MARSKFKYDLGGLFEGDPKPKKSKPSSTPPNVYKTQEEADADNRFAQDFNVRHNLIPGIGVIAGDVGTPKVQFRTLDGQPYAPQKMDSKRIEKNVPDWVDTVLMDDDWKQSYYKDGNDIHFVDNKYFNDPKYTKKNNTFDTGGVSGTPPSVKDLQKKYANNPYAKDRAFWGEYLNESTPWSNGRKVKDMIYNVANQSHVNPALLYSSAMEEGMQLYKTKKDEASQSYNRWAKNNTDLEKKFPIDGFYNYGLDTFGDNFDRLVKKGYLKPEFKDRFTPYDATNEKKQKVKTAAFMSDDDALLAKSAMIRDAGDELDKYLSEKKMKLSPKAKDFFTLAAYNGGVGLGKKMLDSYNQKGYLKDDSFLNPDFKPASYAGVYDNVQKRVQNADILQNEGFFSDYKPTYATGGTAYNWGNAAKIFDAGAGVADSVIGLLENNPNAISKQPLVNATTMRNMASPYNTFAEGGETGDMSGVNMQQLQEMADEYGISVEELMQNFQNADNVDYPEEDAEGQEEETDQEDAEEGDEEEYATGGIHIKPSHKGRFTAYLKRTGSTLQEALHSKNPHVRQMANFARNAKSWHHADGGVDSGNINVEGGEAIETPNGAVYQMKGPKHEQGGIDVNVPDGTKIFSDRLTVGGKSMQERHIARTKKMNKLEALLDKNPHDTILRNTIERTAKVHQIEEDKDMKLQNTVRAIKKASIPHMHMATGGEVEEYGLGGETDDPENPLIDYLRSLGQNIPQVGKVPYAVGEQPIERTTSVSNPNDPYGSIAPMESAGYKGTPTKNTLNTTPYTVGKPEEDTIGSKFTTGDLIGMGGSLFNAIAPIINTKSAKNATMPVLNRFRGFGHDAIEANDAGENLLSTTLANKKSDVSNNANAAFARNRNGAASINTQRALDVTTQMGVDKANSAADDSFAASMVGLLDKRGTLSNQRDFYEMSGEHTSDVERQQNSDNYYTNMGRNLTNFGTNIQGIGKAFNTQHANDVDAELISQLSKYGLSFDESGKLISI